MNLTIDNDFQHKVMTQTFTSPTTLNTLADVQAWRAIWFGGLTSWHSPYKLLVDCTQLTVGPDPAVAQALDVMVRFFNGFFLRKVVGFGLRPEQGHASLPFPVEATLDDAATAIGIRTPQARVPSDFRSQIQLQNHFQQHTVEMNFSDPVVLATAEQVGILRSKLTNNLMQWHSKWSLLIDCTNLEVGPEAVPHLERMFTVLKGFFLKETIGYSPKAAKETYPFPVYRARHRAAAVLEGEGNFSGDKADCKSRQVKE